MGEIATIDRKRAALTTGNHVAAMVPDSIESAWRLSEVIARSGMAPKTYGTDPNKIMVGMLAGLEIGLTPFAALQSIAVINGNPSLWGDGALALIQASNLLEDMDETDDGNTATCTMKRVGRASPIVRTFSMADAKLAGLQGKAGPWTQYTRRMRQMRARSLAMRDGFAEVLKGLRIAEEVRDYVDFAEATPRPAVGVSVPLTGAALLEQAKRMLDEPNEAPAPIVHDMATGEITADEVPGLAPEAADPRIAKLYEIKAALNACTSQDALQAVSAENMAHYEAMTPEMQAEMTECYQARWGELDA